MFELYSIVAANRHFSVEKWMGILVRSWICQKWFWSCLHQFNWKFNDLFNVFIICIETPSPCIHMPYSDKMLIRNNEYINFKSDFIGASIKYFVLSKIITVISVQSLGAMLFSTMPRSMIIENDFSSLHEHLVDNWFWKIVHDYNSVYRLKIFIYAIRIIDIILLCTMQDLENMLSRWEMKCYFSIKITSATNEWWRSN